LQMKADWRSWCTFSDLSSISMLPRMIMYTNPGFH